MRVLLVIESEGLDDLAQTNLVADGVLQRRIVMLDDGDDLVTVRLRHHLTLFRLTDLEGYTKGGVMGEMTGGIWER